MPFTPFTPTSTLPKKNRLALFFRRSDVCGKLLNSIAYIHISCDHLGE